MTEKAFLMRSSSDLSDRRMRTTSPEKSSNTPAPVLAPIIGTAYLSRKDFVGGGVVVVITSGVVVGAGVVVVEVVVAVGVVVVEVVVISKPSTRKLVTFPSSMRAGARIPLA
jgi:hypothetical protein